MIRAVVGTGPRVGTSWVMRQLKEAGVPIHWDASIEASLPKAGNPGGYYETHPSKLHVLDNVVCKVWPLGAGLANIERFVLLERDKEEQLRSISEQMVREQSLLDSMGIDWTAEEFLERSKSALPNLLSIPHLHVFTHELDERIDEIINYLRY